MAIMVVYRGDGVDPAAYAPYEADIRSAPVPPEALLHEVGVDDAGLVIVDIWTSRPAFEAWTESRVKPTLAKYGIDYVEPRVLDVDVVATPGCARNFSHIKTLAREPA